MTFRNRGFSLIEMMVVVAIIAILAGIAYPEFAQYMFKVRRTDGKALLTEIMARQERYYGDRNTYTTDLTAFGYTLTDGEVISTEGYYGVTAAACGGGTIANCVYLLATPKGPQTADAICVNLGLDSRGVKTKSGTGTVANCW